MARTVFNTVPEELLEYAEVALAHFRNMGYTIKIEEVEIGYPYTPTLLCNRQNTIMIVEVISSVDLNRIQEWVSYGKSSGCDFRVALCCPIENLLSARDEEILREIGVGCYLADEVRLIERIVPSDLGLNVTLPDIKKLPMKVRKLIGPAYEQFDKAQWREGFETACQAFEDESRKYLKRHIKRKRIRIYSRSGPTTPSASEINRMTMGQLANTFEKIITKNHSDSTIAKTLKSINKDRIAVVHKRSQKTTERRLRKNVGRHMWSLITAMREVIK